MWKHSLVCLLLLVASASQAQLSPDFSADVRSGCAPIRVLFTDLSTGGADRWQWDLGNGVLSTQQNPSTTYFTPGTYNVRLTIYRGTTDSAVLTRNAYITVFGLPQVNFGASPRFGCLPLQVAFADSSVPSTGSIVDWRWDFGDGTLGSGRNPVHTYGNPGSFRISLTVRTDQGCSNTFSIDNYVTVGDSLEARYTVSVPAACVVPVNVRFTDASIGTNIVSWQWLFGDGGSSTARNPTHLYTTPGTYDVRLVVRNAGGCTDTLLQPAIVTVGSPTASFRLPSGPFCTGRPVVIQNTSTPFPTFDSSVWTFSDGVVLRQFDAARSFATGGVYNFSLRVWKNGCSDVATGSITVLDRPVPSLTITPPVSCQLPHTVNFANTTPNSTVLLWDFGNGQTSTLQAPTHTYNQFGSYNITMIVQHNNGCLDTVVRTAGVVISAPSISAISGLPYDNCAPYATTFVPTVVTNDSVVSWSWDFGDGTTSNLRTPFKSFTTSGTYVVRLTITTTAGCTATFNSSVRLSDRPTAGFTATPRITCPSSDVNFTDTSRGTITRWQWLFGDGGSSSARNPVYQYNDTGWMRVTLIVSNNNCSDTLSVDSFIYVNPPIARFTDSFSCANKLERFFTNTSIGALTWKWYFGDGDSSTVYSPSHRYAVSGNYTVRLVVADTLCQHEASRVVRIIDEEANVEMTNLGQCRLSEVRFIARGPRTNPAFISNYEWIIDGGAPINTTVNFIDRTYTDTATVTIQLVITDLNGCQDTTVQTFRIDNVGTIVNFGPVQQDVCAGSLVSFSDSTRFDANNRVLRWEWSFGQGGADSIFTAGPFGAVYNTAGTYDVRLTVQDSLGCRYSLTRPAAVVVHDVAAGFVASDTLVCVNTPITFTNQSTASGSNAALLTYQWQFGDGQTAATPNASIVYASEGVYDVQLVAVDPYGCTDTLLRPRYITVANARARFEMTDSFSTCPPLLVTFTNTSINNRQNFWDFGNGNNSIVVNPSHTFTQPGSFNVKLRVVGNGGCTDSLTRQVQIRGPQGSFTYAPLVGCPPLLVNFTSTSVNTQFYTWDYSDGLSDITTSATATHAYTVPGNYVPRLILEDGLGCKVPIQGPDTVRVLGAKALIKSVVQNTFCDSATVAFTDSSITNDVVVRYRWNFGDGDTTNVRNPVHVYNSPGRFRVTFEVWTATNCYAIDTLDVPVIIAASPQLDFIYDSAVCIPAVVQFTGVWQNPDTTVNVYRWDFGNGQSSTSLVPAPINYNTPGTLSVRLSAVNNYGCTGEVMKPLIINDTPRVTADPNAFICQGQAATLQAGGALTYRWDADATLSCINCATPAARPLQNRIYRVTGTDISGCQSSDTVLIRVKLPGNLSVGLGDTICVGETVQLRAAGYELFSWAPAATLNNARIPNPLARPTSTTNYVVTGTDSLGCFSDTDTISVIVYPIPQIDIAESSIRGIQGSSVPLRIIGSPDITRYLWAPATDLSCITCPEPTAQINRRITYTLTVTNNGGCVSQDAISVEPFCTASTVFLPNTFSPNGDGNNDVFYPRGVGDISIKSLRIFNRWGELMYERKDFKINDPTAGWNGTYKGAALTPDVYVYVAEVQCGNNELYSMKGNVTLLK